MKRKQPPPKRRRSEATFWRDGPVLEPSCGPLGPLSDRLDAKAGWKRWGTGFSLLALGFGLAAHRTGTEWLLAVTLGPAAGVYAVILFRRLQEWEHHRTKVKPLAYALAGVIDMPPSSPRSWLTVPQDYATNKDAKIVVQVPNDFTAGDQDRKDILRAVEAKLPELETPEPDWSRLNGYRPRIEIGHSEPPPALVTWPEIKEHVCAAGADEFVIGIGRRGKVVKVSRVLDSPHLMINCGSGAGKSNLAAFLALQVMMRGGWAYFMDPKMVSHPWVYKDMDAEYGQLANAGYTRYVDSMHEGLLWLGDHLAERYAYAERYTNAQGDLLRRSPWPPLFIFAEEMNLATPILKEHWTSIRTKDDPKPSPALRALGSVAFAGRQADVHLVIIGQQLTAETLGVSGSQGGAVRENIGIKLLARYTPNAWKMQAGDVPMPPSPSAPGRVQCLAGGEIQEAQVPLVIKRADLRELALSGEVAPVPASMPTNGDREAIVSPVVLSPQIEAPQGADQRLSWDVPARPPGTATLRELAAAGFYKSHEAAKQASKRDPAHPRPVGAEGQANLYRISEVRDWRAGKMRGDR